MSKMIKVSNCHECPFNVLKNWVSGNSYLACKPILMNDFLNDEIKHKCEITDSSKILPNCPLDDFPETGGQTFMEWTEEMRRKNER